jgi:hypothetical protein
VSKLPRDYYRSIWYTFTAPSPKRRRIAATPAEHSSKYGTESKLPCALFHSPRPSCTKSQYKKDIARHKNQQDLSDPWRIFILFYFIFLSILWFWKFRGKFSKFLAIFFSFLHLITNLFLFSKKFVATG